MLAYIVTGSLVVEQIFAVPGIGRAFVQSIINRDYSMIMGTTIVLASLIVIMNLISDILYKIVDPRIDFQLRRKGRCLIEINHSAFSRILGTLDLLPIKRKNTWSR